MPKSKIQWKVIRGEVGPAGMPDYWAPVARLIKILAKRGWEHWATEWKKTKDGMRFNATFRREPPAK